MTAALSADTAVLCRQVVKNYLSDGVETPALRGVNLEVKQGELFMLVGPSGCGKTTLISVIAGILNHDRGDCYVLGHDLKALSDRARTTFRGKEIGFVFQSYNLIPTLSIVENVSIPLLLNGMTRRDANRQAQVLLERVGLASKFAAHPQNLSGGQQQRVAVARALVHNPRLLVCDEPTSALDHDTGHKIMQLFRQVALEDGRTLIIVTHDNRIFEFADRMAVMEDGVVLRIVKSASELQEK